MMPHAQQNEVASLDIQRSSPLRQCALTRDRLAQSEMIRFVRSPQGGIVPDIAARLPGRGVWLKADRSLLAEAIRKNIFARALKQPVSVDMSLLDLVETLLVRRLQGIIGMAKRAGDIVIGFSQVRSKLKASAGGILLMASDSAEDGRMKLYRLAQALPQTIWISGGLTSTELGEPLGRSDMVYGFIRQGAFSSHWLIGYNRLKGYRSVPELNWFPPLEAMTKTGASVTA